MNFSSGLIAIGRTAESIQGKPNSSSFSRMSMRSRTSQLPASTICTQRSPLVQSSQEAVTGKNTRPMLAW